MERFYNVFQQTSEAILLIDENRQVLDANAVGKLLLDLTSVSKGVSEVSRIFGGTLDLSTITLPDQGHRQITERQVVLPDGQAIDLEISVTSIDHQGKKAYSLMLRDVTHRKEMERALRTSEERYELIVRGANDGIWDWNLMTDQVFYSDRWMDMLGLKADQVSHSPNEWFDRVHPEDVVRLKYELSTYLKYQEGFFECEYRMIHSEGQTLWIMTRAAAVWNEQGYAERIAGSQTDISRRKQAEEQLRYDALHDPLTGLANRTLLLDHLKHINERKRRNEDLVFALFFLDFDRFKRMNDTLGHALGDQLLIQAAGRLDSCLRTGDTIARLTGPDTLARIAGDEFVILLEDLRSPKDAIQIAERIVNTLSEPYYLAGQQVNIGVSLGVVVPSEPYDNPEDIIRDADIAMYDAKHAGGARVSLFNTQMYETTLARMNLESELRLAVERQEFEVYYQPIYKLDGDRVVSFEALVRWNHPQRGLILPGEFIGIAEETGLIVVIGHNVLCQACRQVQEWNLAYNYSPPLEVSVNVSVKQIISTGFVQQVFDVLSEVGLPPHNLCLEITESTLMENLGEVNAILKDLRHHGIRIYIDDFGTGYSSLSYLKDLPVDGFKIDRSFVRDIDRSGQEIVKTLISLGRSLGLSEVAEGVESEEQKQFLKTLSCSRIQGYLMARPMSGSKARLFLEEENRLSIRTGADRS
jgi:diguanylate cyclase (GGDEF)-like protein/PAS domain S-box-containing protein